MTDLTSGATAISKNSPTRFLGLKALVLLLPVFVGEVGLGRTVTAQTRPGIVASGQLNPQTPQQPSRNLPQRSPTTVELGSDSGANRANTSSLNLVPFEDTQVYFSGGTKSVPRPRQPAVSTNPAQRSNDPTISQQVPRPGADGAGGTFDPLTGYGDVSASPGIASQPTAADDGTTAGINEILDAPIDDGLADVVTREINQYDQQSIDASDAITNRKAAEAKSGSQSADAAPTCEQRLASATSACTTLPGFGDDPQAGFMISIMTNQLVGMATSIATMGKDQNKQCSVQADIQKVMGALNTVKAAVCTKAINSCTSTCNQEMTTYENAEPKQPAKAKKALSNASTCKTLYFQVAGLATNVLTNVASYQQNSQCEKDTRGNAIADSTGSTGSTAIGDCNDPKNTSLECRCKRSETADPVVCALYAGKPYDPNTNGGSGSLSSSLGGGAGSGSNAALTAAGLPPLPGLEGPGLELGKPNQAQPGQQAMMGGGGGGGLGGGGGNLQSLGDGGGGYGPLDDPRSAITGQANASGGGMGGGAPNGSGGGSGGGGGRGLAGGGSGEGTGLSSLMDKFNLKNFLPKSKVVNRGLAGMSVKSVDGITGPTGPSIFEKATNQYRLQIQKQNVLLDP